MIVMINGEEREISEGETLAGLVEILHLAEKYVAIERNRELIPKTKFAETVLNDGDLLEIVTLVGGG